MREMNGSDMEKNYCDKVKTVNHILILSSYYLCNMEFIQLFSEYNSLYSTIPKRLISVILNTYIGLGIKIILTKL